MFAKFRLPGTQAIVALCLISTDHLSGSKILVVGQFKSHLSAAEVAYAVNGTAKKPSLIQNTLLTRHPEFCKKTAPAFAGRGCLQEMRLFTAAEAQRAAAAAGAPAQRDAVPAPAASAAAREP